MQPKVSTLAAWASLSLMISACGRNDNGGNSRGELCAGNSAPVISGLEVDGTVEPFAEFYLVVPFTDSGPVPLQAELVADTFSIEIAGQTYSGQDQPYTTEVSESPLRILLLTRDKDPPHLSVTLRDPCGEIASGQLQLQWSNFAPYFDTAHPWSLSATSINRLEVLDIEAHVIEPDEWRGDQLTFSWSLSLANAGSLSGKDDVTPQSVVFTPATDYVGEVTVALTVQDNGGERASSDISFEVVNLGPEWGSPPITASSSQLVRGAQATINVSASDQDGDGVVYVYSLTGSAGGGLSLTLDTPTSSASATYTAPVDAIGTDTISVVARDGRGVEIAAQTINIETINRAPVIQNFVHVEAGVARNGTTGLEVQATDADGDDLTYSFAILSGEGSLGGTDSASGKTYTAGTEFGTAELQATVEDAYGATDTATWLVYVGRQFDLGGDISAGRPVYLNILTNNSGELHVAYVDNYSTDLYGAPINTDDDAAIVKKWDATGQSWNQVGGDVAASASFTALAFDGNVPHLAYYDLTNGGVRVQTFDGSVWAAVGTVACPGDSDVPFPAIAVTSTEVNVACTVSSGGLDLRVTEWTGAAWTSTPNASGDGIADDQTWRNQLLVGPNDELFAAYVDMNQTPSATDEDIVVKMRGTSSWDQVGTAFTDQDYDWPCLGTDGTDIYLALLAASDSVVRVYRYDGIGGDWEQVGPDLKSEGVSLMDSIGLSFDGSDLYVGARIGAAYWVYLYHTGSDSWSHVGAPIMTGSTYPRMTAHDGKVYVVYSYLNKLRVSYID